MKKMVNNVILLTACVNPNGMAYTVLQNPDERLKQYKDALMWYLEHTKERIVVVENTLCDFSGDFATYIASGRLELLTFDGNRYDRMLGKGYGEALILKYALEHSRWIAEADLITKITGRLKITNVNRLMSASQHRNTVYANVIHCTDERFFACSGFFIAPPRAIKLLLEGMSRLNDSRQYYFEHLLYETIVEWKRRGNRHREFYLPVETVGCSGTSGNIYTLKKTRYVFALVRYVTHPFGIYLRCPKFFAKYKG